MRTSTMLLHVLHLDYLETIFTTLSLPQIATLADVLHFRINFHLVSLEKVDSLFLGAFGYVWKDQMVYGRKGIELV